MPYTWAKAEVSLGAGLDTKGDLRAAQPPKLDIARDVSFGEPGGVQARLPYIPMSNQIFGGGTLANCRRLAVVNDELCVFTDTALYSWNEQLLKWVLRGTHVATAVDESPTFVTTDEQLEGDRAELNGTVFTVWTVNNNTVYLGAKDKTTKSVLLTPTLVGTFNRPRLVALNTKILLFVNDGANNLKVFEIDPASPATGIGVAAHTVLAANYNLYYDVVKAGTQDLAVGACRRTTTTSYTAFSVGPGFAISTSTKAFTCDGPVAVSAIPDGTQFQVARANGTAVQGDLLTTSTLAVVFSGQAIGVGGGTISQIAACHRSVQNGGAFRCYVFCTIDQSPTGLTWSTRSNWVDTANNLGTAGPVALQLSLASRAFDCNGSVYVWLTFGSSTVFASPSGFLTGTTLQNTYFLYRDDAFLCGKAVAGSGGGFPPTTGLLPGVSAISATSFAWAATRKRKFVAGAEGNADFAARTVVDISFVLDSNDARRVAQIGRTGYIAAGEILQYDGVRLVECGFHIFPWAVGAIEVPGGSLTAGKTYAYKGTNRYQNGVGESERSTTATIGAITLTTGTRVDLTSPGCLTATHKLTVVPAIEFWRTPATPNIDTPFYLITASNPSSTSNPNRYLANDAAAGFASTVQDVLADTAIVSREANPENGAVLESLAPPPAKLILASDTRVYLAGIAGDADAVWYSRLRNEGEIASFHDSLRALVPRPGGDITALAFNNETLTVFREHAIYALPGDGLNNLGQGSNYGPARVISLDVGAVSQESVALTPLGMVFKSSKGWYLLSPSWQLRYIGAKVNAFDADTVYAVHVLETEHHIRVVQSGRMLIWDYSAVTEEDPLGQWAEWTVSSGIHAVMWRGQHIVLGVNGPVAPNTSFASADFGIDVETAWLKLAETQGEFFLRAVAALGEYRSAFLLRIRLARDYQYDGAGNAVYFDDLAWTPSPTTVGSALQVKHPPSINRMQALKVRLTAVTDAARALLICDLSGTMIVATDGLRWAAVLQAVYPGERGNIVALTITFRDGGTAPFSIDVRDHYSYATGRWAESLNTIGVLVTMTASSRPTVAQLEAAITASTHLATIPTPDTPTKIIAASNIGNTRTALLSGGLYGAPTGEALKLTSLALEYGVSTGSINRRLPASQKAA